MSVVRRPAKGLSPATRLYAASLASVFVLLIIEAIFPSIIAVVASWPLAIGGLTIGMAHGAADAHFIRRGQHPGKHFGFYLAAMGLVAAVWWLQPLWAWIGFLVLTAIHFGQEESEFFAQNLPRLWKLLSAFGHGAWIISLPIWFHPNDSFAFFDRIGLVGNVTGLMTLAATQTIMACLPGVLLLAMTANLACLRWLDKIDAMKWLWQTILLGLAAWVLHPEFFVGAYLLFWHAPRHYWEMHQGITRLDESQCDRDRMAVPQANLKSPSFWIHTAYFHVPAVIFVLLLAGLAVFQGRVGSVIPAIAASTVLVYLIVTPPHHWIQQNLLPPQLDRRARME